MQCHLVAMRSFNWWQWSWKSSRATKGKGGEAVIDFVGEKGSTAMGIKMTAGSGYYYIVGYGEEIRVLAVDVIISEKQ